MGKICPYWRGTPYYEPGRGCSVKNPSDQPFLHPDTYMMCGLYEAPMLCIHYHRARADALAAELEAVKKRQEVMDND